MFLDQSIIDAHKVFGPVFCRIQSLLQCGRNIAISSYYSHLFTKIFQNLLICPYYLFTWFFVVHGFHLLVFSLNYGEDGLRLFSVGDKNNHMFFKSRINQKDIKNLHRKPRRTSHWTKSKRSYNL